MNLDNENENENENDRERDGDDDGIDQAFIARLRGLTPASVSASADDGPETPLSIESILYRAGFEAGRDHVRRMSIVRNANAGQWLSLLAASVLTAVVTIPVALGIGRHWQSPNPARVAVQHDASPSETDNAAPEPSDEPSGAPVGAEATPSIKSTRWQNIHSDWHLTTIAGGTPLATLTAFHSRSLETLPRSNWIALEDDPFDAGDTISAGDLDTLTATFDLQVQPR
ncbi:hypothetical protein Mal15_52230 [Stieleria maiorica]|uniref:Uncharacterized protein n=1 Tax=Stieleria maiorica TaxID=2795974 RepID=A0A5B9MMK1_9BACT|nr:hypothetical protein [Stieleria maiorica]QEG01147.1 hypothetical protein Mal15_52230 [Stieleria maiorica]